MNFFDHKNLGNHLLQLCPKVVKHPVCANRCDIKKLRITTKQCMCLTLTINTDYFHNIITRLSFIMGIKCAFYGVSSEFQATFTSGVHKSRGQFAEATKFFTGTPNICRFPEWNLIHVTLLTPRF